jgi:hypothetical protein
MGNDDWDDDALMEGDDPGEPDGQMVAKLASDIVSRFGRDAPLRAEMVAQDALAAGDVGAYKLYKLVEGAAESLLFFGVERAL